MFTPQPQIDDVPYYTDVEKALAALSEPELRDHVLPVLLRALAYIEVRRLHGPREEGKDLLAWRWSTIDTKDWTGFVVKSGDLNAQVGSSAGIRTVLYQVEQVLDHSIVDPLTSSVTHVRECWVVTNGKVAEYVLGEIEVTLRRHHLDKLIRWIDLTTLTRLFNEKLTRPQLDELFSPQQRAT
jgi:hypothetical protein